jgi:hypothetical protein
VWERVDSQHGMEYKVASNASMITYYFNWFLLKDF